MCRTASTGFGAHRHGGVSPAAGRVLATRRAQPMEIGTREGPSEKWPPKGVDPRGEDG